MTVAGCPTFSSCSGKDGLHPVSHVMDATDLETDADLLCPYGLKSSIQNFPFVLCMPVWHGALMQERLLYLISTSTWAVLEKVMCCICVLWNGPFFDLITCTQSLILSHFYVFVTFNNCVLEVLNRNMSSESWQDSLRIYIQSAVSVVNVATT